jgi:hypothetical protein
MLREFCKTRQRYSFNSIDYKNKPNIDTILEHFVHSLSPFYIINKAEKYFSNIYLIKLIKEYIINKNNV